MKKYALAEIGKEDFITYGLSGKEMLEFIGKMPANQSIKQFSLSFYKPYEFYYDSYDILRTIEDDMEEACEGMGYSFDLHDLVSSKERDKLENLMNTVINSFIKRNVSDDLHYYCLRWQGSLKFLQKVLKEEEF